MQQSPNGNFDFRPAVKDCGKEKKQNHEQTAGQIQRRLLFPEFHALSAFVPCGLRTARHDAVSISGSQESVAVRKQRPYEGQVGKDRMGDNGSIESTYKLANIPGEGGTLSSSRSPAFNRGHVPVLKCNQ